MGYRCRKCGILCCSKQVKINHEHECQDFTWSIHRQNINLYDHNYTSDIIIPILQNAIHSNWNYINDVEHSYCWDNINSSKIYENSDIIKAIPDQNITENVYEKREEFSGDHNYVISDILSKRKKKFLKCGRMYKYSILLDKHMVSCRNKLNITCRTCGLICHSYKDLYAHKAKRHQKYDKESL